MIGLKTRIKEMKKLGMTEIKVDIETLEGLLEQSPEAGQVDAIVICYVVFVKGGYNNEEIDSIWFDKEKAMKRKEEVRGYRIENHEIN